MSEPDDQPADLPGADAAPVADAVPIGRDPVEPAEEQAAPPTELTPQPAEPESAPVEPAAAPATGSWPAIGYWAAIGARPIPATVPPAPPPPPAWTKTYELPSARKVVSSGLQLALASSRPVRRASIYIGLLSLGALGPAAILLLLGIGRLLSDPRTAETISIDPSLLFVEQPDLIGVLVLIYLLGLAGAVLLIAISIDAQGMAIAVLGGSASDRPLQLREAVTRARQVFWRLLAIGILFFLVSLVITIVITAPFLRPFDSNEGINFIASIVGTLVLTPFAFVATGIVLGDVGPIEALKRSYALFRARPRIALVVVLFTLVTSAIQTFALGAGLDIAIRVADFLHLSLDQGGFGVILLSLLVLAFIVAFGSLTFTIAAIVAAPQVAGFLGLTFYSGGLDRARIDGAAPPRRFRWVTLPMLASMIGLAIVAGLGLPVINGFEPRAASPLLAFLRTASEEHGKFMSPLGTPLTVEDPQGDHGVGAANAADILVADATSLTVIPDWLLDDVFKCGSSGVACGDNRDMGSIQLDEGALLFVQRMAAAPPQVPGGRHIEWGPMLRVRGSVVAPALAGTRFDGANHRFSTALDGMTFRIREYIWEGGWVEYQTSARSAWLGDLLVTIVPYENVADEPTAWDAYASSIDPAARAYDNIRPADGEVIEIELLPWIDFVSADFLEP